MDDELGDASFHPTCVDAPVDDDDRPKPSGAHPFFGKRPGPLVQPG